MDYHYHLWSALEKVLARRQRISPTPSTARPTLASRHLVLEHLLILDYPLRPLDWPNDPLGQLRTLGTYGAGAASELFSSSASLTQRSLGPLRSFALSVALHDVRSLFPFSDTVTCVSTFLPYGSCFASSEGEGISFKIRP